MKSLLDHMNWNRPADTIAGQSIGTSTSTSVCMMLQPSIFAASSSSRGMLRMNWISMYTKYVSCANSDGTISAR